MWDKVKDCVMIIMLGLITVFVYIFSTKQTKLINQFIEIDKRKEELIKQIMNAHSSDLKELGIKYAELFHALEAEHEYRLIELQGNPDEVKRILISKGFDLYE